MGRRIGTVATALLVAVALTACSEKAGSGGNGGTTDRTPSTLADGAIAPKPGDGSIVSKFAGSEWFAGTVPDKAVKADPSKPAIKLGIMTTDEGPIAALPELHDGINAAVSLINDELGGVDGHRIETVFCGVDLTAEKSQQCARTMVSEKVQAVLGGINIASGAAIAVLNENNIPWVGGIPINFDEMDSPLTFQFSGGTPGAMVAFADDAVNRLKAKKVAMMFASIDQVAKAREYARPVLEAGGVELTEVPFDLLTQDFASIARKAASSNPDAIIVAAADSACPKVMQAVYDLQSPATVYMVGSCADQKWLDQVAPEVAEGTVFNIESILDQTASKSADTEIYTEAMTKYQPKTSARGAATVSFRGVMNLWSVMDEIGGAKVTSETIVAAFRKAKDHPSFDGYPFTCDGKQMEGLRGLCSPQQALIQMTGPQQFKQVSDGWIDVPAILAKAKRSQ